ncbi:MAG: peptidoglycan-binding protein [Clostridia bacterium]|nr:peptidoglycan-binding protein [Clostridia bacterium]
MRRNRILCLLIVIVMAVLACGPAYALKASTLCRGSKGDNVRLLQQALINLGYLSGKADGKFGPMTEEAVIRFQKANSLTADGLAGTKTLSLLLGGQSTQVVQPAVTAPAAQVSAPVQVPASSESSQVPAPAVSSSSSGGLFGGDYSTISIGDRGSRVKTMQQALVTLKYLSGKADGIFGQQTLNAVYKFQSRSGLKQDGLAGKKTLTALESAVISGSSASQASASSTQASASAQTAQASSSSSASKPDASSAVTTASVSAPGVSSIRLLHWFNDVKPSLKNGDHLLIYDPATGLSWTLSVLSRGRHCDSEPLTRADTDTMVQSFGGKNTWSQHGVYVKLPNGTWTIGSTHDMPHLSGSIKDNGFDGHLCVHFLRNMEEAETNDPNYGVSNQKTIRELWKRISGQEINY